MTLRLTYKSGLEKGNETITDVYDFDVSASINVMWITAYRKNGTQAQRGNVISMRVLE